VEALRVVLLVKVHAVREHLFEITNLDWHVRRQLLAVNFESRRVNIVEGPDPKVFDEVMELGTGLEVKRFVFLHRHYRQAK